MANLIEILTDALTYVVAISILVAVHEFGHYWVARRLGIKTLRYSIGFGRVLWSRHGKDGTEYAVSAIPLGGYVKLLDERESAVAEVDLPRAFNRQPVWKRILVLLAGPGFNFVFAFVAYWMLLTVGVPGLTPVVGAITPGSLAASAGLQDGDLIERVAGEPVHTRDAAVMAIVGALVDHSSVALQVKGKNGAERQVDLHTAGRSRELTEPDALLPGLGFDFWVPQVPAVLGQFVPDGPAQRAGLKSGDVVLRVDDHPVKDFRQLRDLIEQRANQEAIIDVRRGDDIVSVRVAVGTDQENGKEVGRIGVGPAPVPIPESMRTVQRYNLANAAGGAARKTWDTSALTVKLLWNLAIGKVSVKSISGPIGIAAIAGFAAKQGLISFVSLLALISISVGILNLLPVPILDGGQILYQFAELLKGSPVSERAQILGQQVGMVLLILLMGLALFNDLAPHLS